MSRTPTRRRGARRGLTATDYVALIALLAGFAALAFIGAMVWLGA